MKAWAHSCFNGAMDKFLIKVPVTVQQVGEPILNDSPRFVEFETEARDEVDAISRLSSALETLLSPSGLPGAE